MNLPKYQCHKVVEALKLARVEILENGNGILVPVEDFPAMEKASSWVEIHQPKPGGYWVRYEDGYESWSPAAAFESGYTKI
jgi:hypothetical protein